MFSTFRNCRDTKLLGELIDNNIYALTVQPQEDNSLFYSAVILRDVLGGSRNDNLPSVNVM